MRRWCTALAVSACCALSSCGGDPFVGAGVPECEPTGELVTIAQTVPSATFLPCVESLPIGWSFDGLEVRDGRARFWLGNDRLGPRAVTVTLAPDCDTATASELPSTHPEVRRSLRVDEVGPRRSGAWLHEFEGGCTTSEFTVPPGRYDAGSFERELEATLELFPRDVIAEEVRRRYGAELDAGSGTS